MTATPETRTALVERLDACLPQTQCTQCGYPRCRAYAEALADGRAAINQCPPGGDATIRLLGGLLRLPPCAPDPRFGTHRPRARAVIDEALCIGCRKCIDACPVDAIVGARKLMHTVIARECSGCELCLPPCPVDCIDLVVHAQSAFGPPPSPASGRGNEGEGGSGGSIWPEYSFEETARWRARTEARLRRLARLRQKRRTRRAAVLPHDREKIRADIRAAVERVKTKKKNQM